MKKGIMPGLYEYENSKGEPRYKIVYRYTVGGEQKMTTKRFKKKQEAKDALYELNYSKKSGSFVAPDKITVNTFLTQWLTIKKKSIRENTYNGYKVNVHNHIIPIIGKIPIQKLNSLDIENLYSALSDKKIKMGKNLSSTSINYVHRVLKQALDYAIKMDLIVKNPIDKVDKPKVNKFEASFYDSEEIKQLLSCSEGDELNVPISLAVLAGLRRGEALGLTWDNVNFNNNTIRITRQLNKVTVDGPIFSSPKSGKSIRTLVISNKLISILKHHRKLQDGLGIRFINKFNLVCCDNNGMPIDPIYFSKQFSRFLELNKLKHIRFHDLRHSNCSLLLAAGVPIKTVADMLGHSSISITADIYGHVNNSMQQRAASEIDNILNSDNENQMLR